MAPVTNRPRFRLRFPHTSDFRSDASGTFWTRTSASEPPQSKESHINRISNIPLLLDEQVCLSPLFRINHIAYVLQQAPLPLSCAIEASLTALPPSSYTRQNAQIKPCEKCCTRFEANIKMPHSMFIAVTYGRANCHGKENSSVNKNPSNRCYRHGDCTLSVGFVTSVTHSVMLIYLQTAKRKSKSSIQYHGTKTTESFTAWTSPGNG